MYAQNPSSSSFPFLFGLPGMVDLLVEDCSGCLSWEGEGGGCVSWEGEGGVCSESASLATESGVVSGRGSKYNSYVLQVTSAMSECATKSHYDNIQSHSQTWKGRPGNEAR